MHTLTLKRVHYGYINVHLKQKNLTFSLFTEGRSEYWILYDYMLYNKNTYLHTSPAAGGYTLDIEQMGGVPIHQSYNQVFRI